MKKEKINLKVWMFSKIILALLLLGYYWMCTRDNFMSYYSYIQYVFCGLAGSFITFQTLYKKDIFDEFAKENLKTTDSICLKIVYGLLIIGVFICMFSNFSGKIIGWYIILTILFITILRTTIFAIIDEKGYEWICSKQK